MAGSEKSDDRARRQRRFTIDPEGAETGALGEMADLSGADVLEVGCGDGRLTLRYAEQAASVLAIDTAADEVETARDATPRRLRPTVTFEVADITEVDLAPAAYDVAILAHSL